MKELLRRLQKQITVWLAIQKLMVAVKLCAKVHKFESRNCDNHRKVRACVGLIEMNVLNKKTKQVEIKQRLWIVTLRNFQKMKRKGWLPKYMRFDEYGRKSFYVSNPNRTYAQEQQVRLFAKIKYKEHLKEQP